MPVFRIPCGNVKPGLASGAERAMVRFGSFPFMRIFLRHGNREQGPMTLEELRDRLDLRMIAPDQPCRIAGIDGTYVAGEIVSGQLFRGWQPEEDEDESEDDAEDIQGAGGEWEDATDEEEDHDEDGTEEADEEDDGGEEEEFEEDEEPDGMAWDLTPLWEGRPGYSAYPGQILFILLLAGSAVTAFLLDWSGWLGAALVALLCCCVALLLGKRQGTHYAIYQRRLEWTEPGFIARTREVPRSAVHAIEISAPFPGNLLGRADLVFVHDRPGMDGQVVFRQIARAHKVRQLWRS